SRSRRTRRRRSVRSSRRPVAPSPVSPGSAWVPEPRGITGVAPVRPRTGATPVPSPSGVHPQPGAPTCPQHHRRPLVSGRKPMTTASAGARRVLRKLSGEEFGGGSVGLDPDVVASIAKEIATAVHDGVQVAIVVGGGNFFRGAELSQRGLDRARADYMGMLGTVMNCLAL